MKDNLMFDLNRIATGNYPSLMFINQIFQRGLTETASFDCSSAVNVDEVLKKLNLGNAKIITHHAVQKRPNNYRNHFIDMNNTILSITYSGDFTFSIVGASKDRKALDALMNKILAMLPPLKATANNVIPITYWALAGGNAVRRIRYGTVPVWNDSVALNYAGDTRKKLTSLMAMRPPIVAGRMLLFHGVPGTGKSYMVRTLAQNWGKWCTTHYIVDPERFLGDANYMLSVIFDNEEEKMEGSLEGLTVAELYAQSREQRQVVTKTNTRSLGFVRS